ncbi:unnamed protein product [Ophioblennius macclurei]
MSVSGMKKQLHKASQLLNERLMGAEGTKLDEDFLQMEKSIAAIQTLLSELLSRTTEFLQPNPAYRAKLSMLSTVSRMRGQGRGSAYPQTEGMLGDVMVQYGEQLGDSSHFGGALLLVGGALREVSQARQLMDVGVTRTFLDPLQELEKTEMKEIRFQLKKVNGRRLDFDYKRRRREKLPAEEIRQAGDKFISSKELAERSMFLLLHRDEHQLTHLAALVAALLDFHRSAHGTLLGLRHDLQAQLTAASNRAERRFRPKKIRVRSDHSGSISFYHQPTITAAPPPVSPYSCSLGVNGGGDRPCCRALYSFQASRDGELGFGRGDIITLSGRLDGDWLEGELGGRSGLVPAAYVEVLVPLPLP